MQWAPWSASDCRDQIIADPEKCFQEFISEKLLAGRALSGIIVSSNLQALPFLQDKLLESSFLISVKES